LDELSRRRLELDGAAALNPPLVFDGVFRSTVADLVGVTDMLVGVGAAPGAASGPAAVVIQPTDPSPPGSVLVAPATDTAWTPLFLAAAAVVTDLGSFMSHSSIVARELGIPAVVNTGTATSTIRSGQPTRVDGDRGLVFLRRDETV
jgi:pyruvate,water dikinase